MRRKYIVLYTEACGPKYHSFTKLKDAETFVEHFEAHWAENDNLEDNWVDCIINIKGEFVRHYRNSPYKSKK